MVKTYLRYELKDTFGIINSNAGQKSIQTYEGGKLAITAALECVCIWNVKQGTLTSQLRHDGSTAVVTCLTLSGDEKTIAVGYEDGTIRLWNLAEGECTLTLNGHRAAVTCLQFHSSGSMLASGSADTNVIIWDCVGETGLFRLHGHKNKVTDCRFFTTHDGMHKYLVTSSTDTYVKVWDLDTQHCVQTMTQARGEVWSLDVNPQMTRLVAGAVDKMIRVWSIKQEGKSEEDVICSYVGEVPRNSNKRVNLLRYNRRGTVLACQSADKTVDFFKLRSEEELKKKMKRRLKRQREKKKAKKAGEELPANEEESKEATAEDELEPQLPFRAEHKINSFCFCEDGSKDKDELTIALSLNTNTVGTWGVSLRKAVKGAVVDKGAGVAKAKHSVVLPGHRSGVRCVSLSADDSLLLSCDASQVKVWNVNSHQCVRTLDTGYGLCGLFVPGARYVVLGTKTGHLEVWELASGVIVEKAKAHEGPVWSLDLTPDKKGFLSGGADKQVMCWEFELVDRENSNAKRLSVVHTRTLKVSEEVLCVKNSPDGKLIAIGLMDSTVKVFYADSFKFFISLYGHRLPVLCMDISSDSTLLITGSADKNVKVWGLDFGDCHKSMFAHADSVMKVQFAPKTHYFFSAGKDKAIKYWDADKFEHVLTLQAHHAEVWGLAVGSVGDVVVTSSNDKSIRVWNQTDEPVFLEEEQEKRLEEIFDKNSQQGESVIGDVEGAGVEARPESSQVSSGKGSKATLKAGEKLIDAMDVAKSEKERWEQHAAMEARAKEMADDDSHASKSTLQLEVEKQQKEDSPAAVEKLKPNMLLMGRKPDRHVLQVLRAVPSADLEEALMVLPFAYVCKLTEFLLEFLRKGWEIELSVRCVLFLVSTHQKQIVSNQVMIDALTELRKITRKRVRQSRDRIGFNMAGLKFLDSCVASDRSAFFFGEPEYKKPKRDREVVKLVR